MKLSRPRRIFSALPPIFALVSLGVSGCARTPRAANTLRIATESDASTLDPALSYDSTSINFVRVLYRGLVDFDAKANIVGAIAKGYEVSRDGKTYTFHLRPDARFHSGRRVVAEDFRFALERVLDPKPLAARLPSDGLSIYTMIDGAAEWTKDRGAARKLAHIRGIEVPDENTIVFHLTKPDLTFLSWLALPFAYAVRPEWVRQLAREDKTLSENPDGTGPFRFVSWVHDASLTLEKNPDYFDKSLPKADRFEVQMANSATLQMMRFERGDNDVFGLTDAFPPDFLRFKAAARYQPWIQHAPMLDVRYVCLNTEVAPFKDVLVRRALNYAINRARIVKFRAGRAVVARGVIPPGVQGYNPQLKGYAYDSAKAQQLLRAANFKNDAAHPIVLWYASNEPWYEKAALSIQQDLKAVGMDVDLKKATYSEVKVAAGRRHNIQMSIIGWSMDFGDPSNVLDVLLNGEKITDSSSNNRAFYSNPRVNKLLDAALGEVDKPRRLKMYQAAEQLIMNDAPWVPLNHSERYIVTQPWVSGYKLDPSWSARYEEVKVNNDAL